MGVSQSEAKTWARTELTKCRRVLLIQSRRRLKNLLHWNAYNKGTFCGRFKAYPARAHTELTERALALARLFLSPGSSVGRPSFSLDEGVVGAISCKGQDHEPLQW